MSYFVEDTHSANVEVMVLYSCEMFRANMGISFDQHLFSPMIAIAQ